MGALDFQNEANTHSLVEAAILRKSPAAPESARALDGQSHSVTIRQKVHVTHFVRFHDDWDFDDDAYVVEETDTRIRISADPHHVSGELTITFDKNHDLLVKPLPL